jgi:hypothetical protein
MSCVSLPLDGGWWGIRQAAGTQHHTTKADNVVRVGLCALFFDEARDGPSSAGVAGVIS